MPSLTFTKQERLKRQKVIQRLFKEGKSFSSFPLRLVYIFDPKDANPQDIDHLQVQFAATVPKKKFPKAVHRNRIRRQIKEGYRLDKHQLQENLGDQLKGTLSLMFIYVSPEALPYAKIERATQYLLKKLIRTIREVAPDQSAEK